MRRRLWTVAALGDDRPAAGRRDRADRAHHRLQHGDAAVQEYQVPGVGLGRPDQHPALLAVLLPQYGRYHLRGRLGRRRPPQHRQAGAARHAGGGGAQGLHPARIRQQAGPARRAQRRADLGGHGALRHPQPPVVHQGDHCDAGCWPLRGL